MFAFGRMRKRYMHRVKDSFLRFNFYRFHLLYFILVIIVTSGILYGSSTANFGLAYIDAISLCTSAICNVGLNTVDLGNLTGFQQSVLFVLMLMGDLSIVTISVVVVRRYYFAKRMKHLMNESRAGRQIAQDIEQQQAVNGEAEAEQASKRTNGSPNRRNVNVVQRSRQKPSSRSEEYPRLSQSHTTGYGSFPAPWHWRGFHWLGELFNTHKASDSTAKHHYLSFHPKLDHKGRFVALDSRQRAELGGVEYRALKVLTWLLSAYCILWLGIIMVILAPYTTYSNASITVRTSQPGDLNPAWWAVFATVSAYTNTGMNLLNQNMIPFAQDYLILIITGAAILGGNTLYPVFLRLTVWLLSKCVRRTTELHHSLSFLLQHPRRCYLLLFPSRNTWILFAVQVSINLLAWIFWIVLNVDQPSVDPGIPPGQRVMDGLYQAHGLRASGMYIITISEVAPALQFFYLVVMYISAYPIIMSLRATNIYEERSLGQTDSSKYGRDSQEDGNASKSQLGAHIRNQLAYDLWWLLAAMFLICIIEHGNLSSSAPGFSIFSIMFEVVSAYGTVGLSLGVPYDNYSFSGAWHVLSKLILLTVMLRGRHRILPMAVDRAILIPGQELMKRLDEEVSNSEGPQWREIEERIREDERGAQAERTGNRQQDPE